MKYLLVLLFTFTLHAQVKPIYLIEKQGGFLGDGMKWNFTKFLIDANKNVIDRYASSTKPKNIKSDIEKLLH